MTGAFLNGFILALGLILPLGVQNLFIFHQGAARARYSHVLPIVVTASLCDTLLILAAVFGLSVVVWSHEWIKALLLGVGILFLLYMGWATWNSKPHRNSGNDHVEKLGMRKQIVFVASVSLLNPHAIMDTIGVIGTSSLQYRGIDKTVFACSCIAVSWLWFAGLALAGRMMGSVDRSGKLMLALNKISALIMWGTAVSLGASLIH